MFEISGKCSQDLEINKEKVISENIWEPKKSVSKRKEWMVVLGVV